MPDTMKTGEPEPGPAAPLPPPPPGAGRSQDSGGRGVDAGREGPDPGELAITGMWVALAPILMLFMAFVTAYIIRQTLGRGWIAVPIPDLLWGNTVVLLCSGATLEVGRRRSASGAAGSRAWLRLTLGLGLLFLAGQLIAWRQLASRGVGMGTTPHGSFFYLLTGTHAVHLIGGIIGLAFASTWPEAGYRRISRRVAVRLAAIYWHFLALLWLGLFLLLALWK